MFLPRGDLASNSSPQNIEEAKIYSGTCNIVGGVTSKAPTGLEFRVLHKPTNVFAFTNTVHPVM